MKRLFAFPTGLQRGGIFVWLIALAWWAVSTTALAQTTLKSVEIVQPKGGENLEIDFVLPQPDRVSTFEASTGGTALAQDKVKFTPADKVPNYRCAVLLMVDKTLGSGRDAAAKEKLTKVVRTTLTDIAAVGGTAPYQFGVGTIAAGKFETLAPMGSEKSIINSAIEKLTFDGGSPELYLGTKKAVDWLGGTPAERKFLVVISDGTSQDKEFSLQDVVQAALKAKVHICTIGFPKSGTAVEGAQKLEALADGTQGYTLRAEGADLKLPNGAVNNLVKFAVSGGKAEIDLKGLKAPVALTGSVQTEFGKTYTFSHNVSAIEAAPAQESTSEAAPLSKWAALKAKAKSHLILTICGLIALIVALVILVVLVVPLLNKSSEGIVLEPSSSPPNAEPVPAASDDETTKVTEPVAPVAPALAWLVILDAEETRYPITKPAIRIGRKPDNDIVMRNNSVSSYHAEILKRGDKFVITDLDSSNKIVVRGKLVEKAPLEDGDIIELGEVRLRFVVNQLTDSVS